MGGLSWQTSSDKLKEYFGMFGTVTDVLIMKDPITQVRVKYPWIVSNTNFISFSRGVADSDSLRLRSPAVWRRC